MNLLEETLEILKDYEKTLEDVVWYGTGGEVFTTPLVELLNIHYDEGYGAIEILEYLILVGEDWWLERCEYDGSEWWDFKQFPQKPIKSVLGFAKLPK